MILSIVVPCFNEEEVIYNFYNTTKSIVEKIEYISSYEFIFVDDGSNDKTYNIVSSISKNDKRVKCISFSRNFGKESAILAGLKASRGDLVVLIDADLQHPPSLLPSMTQSIVNDGYDSVMAVRKSRIGEKAIRSFFSKSFYKCINRISDTKIEQNSTDFRMMRREFVDSVLELGEYNRFTKGIFSWVGYKIHTIEYDNIERKAGKTKWNIRSLFKYSFDGIISFSTFPLVVSSLCGFIAFSISIIMLVIFLLKSLIWGDPVRGFPTLVCIILFIGGIQLLCIGILGSYISKIYLEVKNRPKYIVKSKINIDDNAYDNDK